MADRVVNDVHSLFEKSGQPKISCHRNLCRYLIFAQEVFMKKILVFTDSRGQHKPRGGEYLIFAERLRDEIKDTHVDLVLCPMKWTTTLDFFEYAEQFDISKYDWVILYTGIVEWSPRPQLSALNDLYNNLDVKNTKHWFENSIDYSQKITNNKKSAFDFLFGEVNIKSYLNKPFEVEYEGQPTINMYSLEMAENSVAPKLKSFKNLVFVNSNRLLPDWEGDFKRGRPKNINVTHEYSDIISKFFDESRLIDLRVWNAEEIKKYTCDNMHLTKDGSDWIFNELIKKLGLNMKSDWEIKKEFFDNKMTHSISDLLNFRKIERFLGEKQRRFLSAYGVKQYLATLIIGFKIKDDDSTRLKNMQFLLEWLDFYYEGMFDILLVEQDKVEKLSKEFYTAYSNVRYEFIYNPMDYNRGWGYNVAVKDFCKKSEVVVLMDTDVLTGSNFVSDIRDCYIGKYKIISPYQNIYYTDEKEVGDIRRSKSFVSLKDKGKIKNPVTLTGGVVIFNRNTYLELKGFEQYIGYGCEDRSLDVIALGLCDLADIKVSPFAYIHLYHPTDKSSRKNFTTIYDHLKINYKCEWSPKLNKTDFIHSRCVHISKEKLVSLLIKKHKNFGDMNLYRKKRKLTTNGRLCDINSVSDEVILPPEPVNLNEYYDKEVGIAPDVDFSELEQFRNAFLGERCFIIGNGPSLNSHDLSLLRNEFTFGVNSFYYKTRETGFRPTFYVVEDSSVMKENLQEIREYYAPFKFFPTVYKKLHPKKPNTFFFKMNRGFYEKSSPNYCVPRFSTDVTKELYCGQSVTYINLQLAYFMGFAEVYLIGMDFSYVIPKSHKRKGDVLLSDSDDPNHFHKDYFGKGKTWKDPKLERVGVNYRMAKLVYESVGRKIYNATIGGSLEIFDRVNYISLFHEKNIIEKIAINANFHQANALMGKHQFSDALVHYVNLAKTSPGFIPYIQGAILAYSKSSVNDQPIQPELINELRGLIK